MHATSISSTPTPSRRLSGRSAGVTALTALLIASGAALAPPTTATTTPPAMTTGPNPVVVWNDTAGKVALAACIAPLDNPLHESRMYAMMHIAMHDALQAIDRRSTPYVFRGRASGPTSVAATVAAAAHDVLVSAVAQIPAPFPQSCLDAGTAVAQDAYADALAAVPDGPAKTRGIALGRTAALAVIRARAADGSDTPLIDDTFPQGSTPGAYRFTPGSPFAFAPGWGRVTPFTLGSASQFRPGPPPALTSSRYARDVAEVKRLGGDGVVTPSERTPRQTETALFWYESSPLAWNRIARSIATDRRLGVWEAARLFGLLDLALADGYVASFDAKYDDLFWRPVTAIRLAATDANPATTADPTWTPLRTTGAVPEYDSAHSVQGGAAAAVIRGFLGTDQVTFTQCSRTVPAGRTCADAAPVIRRYASLSQAARENGESRILIGFHFRTAVQRGIAHGTRIGDHTVATSLTPVTCRAATDVAG